MPFMEERIIIPDIHGNLSALQKTLVESGLGEQTPSGFRILKDVGSVTTLGDYIDRGQENCEVLDLLIEMQEKQRRSIQLVGNHECLMQHILRNPEDVELIVWWVRNGGSGVLKEIAQNNSYRIAASEQPPFPVSIPPGISAEVVDRAQRGWMAAILEGKLQGLDTARAFAYAQKIFLEGKYYSLFASMQLVDDTVPGTWMVHGRVNEKLAQLHPAKSYPIFPQMLRYNLLEHLLDAEEIYGAAVWGGMENGQACALTIGATQELMKNRINLVIRGHRIPISGNAELHNEHGVHVIHADAGMAKGGEGRWSFIRLAADGKVTAHSARGVQEFGYRDEDGTFMPA